MHMALVVAALLSVVSPTPARAQSARECFGMRPTIEGTSGDDTLTGTSGADVIVGYGGKDKIRGLGGNDRLCGNAQNDNIFGGRGRDSIGTGTGGWDDANGGPDNDLIRGPSADVRGIDYSNPNMYGGGGNDRLEGGASPDKMAGGPGDDVMSGGESGGFQNDVVDFTSATRGVTVDLEQGTSTGQGRDTISGVEQVHGSRFNDHISGNVPDQALVGDEGDDRIEIADGTDSVGNGGPGNDIVVVIASGEPPPEGAEGHILSGEGGNDDLRAGTTNDQLEGGGGDDSLDGGEGTDEGFGGPGHDRCTSIEQPQSCEE
jgi:Ca2+-binding RTX toxin-like protein